MLDLILNNTIPQKGMNIFQTNHFLTNPNVSYIEKKRPQKSETADDIGEHSIASRLLRTNFIKN